MCVGVFRPIAYLTGWLQIEQVNVEGFGEAVNVALYTYVRSLDGRPLSLMSSLY